jgi:hypothetical protein
MTENELLEKLRIAIADPKLNLGSTTDNTENWDSLGQLSIITTLSRLSAGKTDLIVGIEDIKSIEALIALLKVNNIIK